MNNPFKRLKPQVDFVLIDANSLLSKAYFTDNPYLWIDLISQILLGNVKGQPNVMFCFDSENNHRRAIYPDYKANRPKSTIINHGVTRQEFVNMVEQVLVASLFQTFKVNGAEADDLLGSLSTNLRQHGYKVLLVSGDKDIFQLIDEQVALLYLSGRFNNRKLYTRHMEKEIKKVLGVNKDQLTLFKALAGDTSDNIKGINGVGAVYAKKLIEQYQTLDEIFHAAEIGEIGGKLGQNINNDREMGILSYDLGIIRRDLKLDWVLMEPINNQAELNQVTESFKDLYEATTK